MTDDSEAPIPPVKKYGSTDSVDHNPLLNNPLTRPRPKKPKPASAKPDTPTQTLQSSIQTKRTPKPPTPPKRARTKKTMTAGEKRQAAQTTRFRSPSEKGKRRKWGKQREELPSHLYERGITKTKCSFSGPQETYDRFDEYCAQHTLTKWEALELLLRRTGPEPIIEEPNTF